MAGERQGHAEQGITLVVSPLIALMKDQVDALLRRGIKAAVLDSTQAKEQYLVTVDAMVQNLQIPQRARHVLTCTPHVSATEHSTFCTAPLKD